MKVITSATERQKQDNTPISFFLAFSPYLLFLSQGIFYSLCSSSVLVTTCRMRRYQQPNQVGKVVLLFLDMTGMKEPGDVVTCVQSDPPLICEEKGAPMVDLPILVLSIECQIILHSAGLSDCHANPQSFRQSGQKPAHQ